MQPQGGQGRRAGRELGKAEQSALAMYSTLLTFGVPGRLMVRVAVTARTNRVSIRLPVIVSDGLNGYSLSGDGRRPPCHRTLLAAAIS